jgi:hypothetical protein
MSSLGHGVSASRPPSAAGRGSTCLAVLAGVATLGAYSSCDRRHDDPWVPPAVDRIAIVPHGGVIRPDARIERIERIELRVDAWDADGNYIWLEDRTEATVAWTAAVLADGSVSVPTDDAVLLTPPDAVSAELRVHAPLTGTLRVTARLTMPGVVREAGVLFVEPDASAADRVVGKPTAGTVVAMLDACRRDGTAVEPVFALVYAFANEVPLAENLTSESCPRPTESALFSSVHRMLFRDAGALASSSADDTWTHALGDELAADTMDWRPPDEILLHMHYFLDAGTPHDWQNLGDSQVTEANNLMAKNRVGIRFVALHPAPAGSDTTHAHCADSYIEEVLGIPLADTRLHVVLAETISSAGSAAASGLYCAAGLASGRVILLKRGGLEPSLLAHELGHALGHRRARRLADSPLSFNHPTDSTPGFDKTNLMRLATPGHSREWLTIGQAFRMNVDAASWYQIEPGIADRHPGRVCGCEPYRTEVCPRLDRHPGAVLAPNPSLNYCGTGGS